MTTMTPAEAYETYLVPFVFQPWVEQVLGEVHLQPGQAVLDLGCGTGIAARLAATAVGRGGSVAGIDIDEGMLSMARRSTTHERAAIIDWRSADATSLPFPDNGFDLVLCFEALQFFLDRAKALAEARRVLKPGGRFLGTVWASLEANVPYHALAEGLARFVSPEAARLPPFALPDPAAIVGLLGRTGFVQVKVEPRSIARPAPSAADFVNWVAAGAPTTRHRLSLLAEQDRDAFLGFVEARLERFRRGTVLELPTVRNVFAAAKPEI